MTMPNEPRPADGDPYLTAAPAPRDVSASGSGAAAETQEGTPAQQSPASTVDGDPWQTRSSGPHASSASINIVPIPGYEMQGVLGRGGMGVVYRAMHQKLHRQVAVKMILTGADADAEALERFRMEAEAAARLQHPNIVQVHDVGEHEGRAFFTMEMVNGPSLARVLAGKPVPASIAAPLIQALARAVHYAHQKGIVHRDLKPGNVLLQLTDPAAGTDASRVLQTAIPKITDFGLAKHLDSQSGLTRTGAVLGTPSYMAPEQAAGASHAIGPATDVYAVGAILYDALTGRPPFRGGTVLETLEQVRHVEPTPPRQLQPGVPRDLETICLTAMAKEPSRRYPSALALAQDLELFCAGEPIRTRREGQLAKLYRKAKRRPLLWLSVAILLTAATIAALVGPRAYRDRQVALAAQEIEARLDAPELTEAYLRDVEERIAELDEPTGERAVAARRRLYQRFADAIRDRFRDRLSADEAAPLQEAVGWLTPRDPDLAALLGRELGGRVSAWQPVLQLAAPFDGWEQAFLGASQKVQPAPDQQSLRRPPGARGDFYVATNKAQPGDLKAEAVLAPTWQQTAQFGLALNAEHGLAYTFLLSVPESFARIGEPTPLEPLRATFADARKTGRVVSLAIIRSQEAVNPHGLLVLATFNAAELFANLPPDGSLRVAVQRDGERLHFQVNERTVEFRDIFTIPPTAAVRVSLYWPPETALLGLRIERRARPQVVSELEHADELSTRRDHDATRAAYEQVWLQTKDELVRQEARYKQAICLLALGRAEQAQAAFEEVSGQGNADADLLKGPCWPALADCQLLLMFARRNDPPGRAAADAMLDRMIEARRDRRRGEFGAVVPFAEVASVLNASSTQGLRAFVRKPADLVIDVERSHKAATLFELNEYARLGLRAELVKVYHLAGRENDALRTSYELLREFKPYLERDPYWGTWVHDAHCWLLRRTGEDRQGALRAVKELDAWLFLGPSDQLHRDVAGPFYFGLVERARLHAAMKMWDEAERDLDRFLALEAESGQRQNGHRQYGFHAAACLLQGFLRERRGDKAGAQAAWRRVMVQAWAKQNPGDVTAHILGLPANISLVQHGIMASLTGELSDQDAEDMVTRLMTAGAANASGPFAALGRLVKVPPAALREMWRTERGRDWARRIAFHDLSYEEYFYTPQRLMMAEYMHHSALPGPLSAEHEALIWKLVVDCQLAYQNGKVTDPSVIALGTAWKGGWDPLGVARAALDSREFRDQPQLRGPLAYLLGHRALPKRTADATRYFTIASQTGPDDAPWRSLAQAELKRLQAKPPPK